MHSENFEFWEMAFKNKSVDIIQLAKMTGSNGQITTDEFQEITGLNYIPNIIQQEIKYISTSSIINNLANIKLDSMKKENLISSLTKQVAADRIESMKKDNIIKTLKDTNSTLIKQIANVRIEIINIKNKEKVGNQ